MIEQKKNVSPIFKINVIYFLLNGPENQITINFFCVFMESVHRSPLDFHRFDGVAHLRQMELSIYQ